MISSFFNLKKNVSKLILYVGGAVTILIFLLHVLNSQIAGNYNFILEEDIETQFRLKGHLMANDSRVIHSLRANYLRPPSTKAYNFNPHIDYRSKVNGSSWPSIFKRLEKLFGNEPPGFFVESGALDGEYFSNSLWLEKNKGWNGLLIEPNPKSFKALSEKNRKSWSAHSCISIHSYPKSSTFTGFSLPKNDIYPPTHDLFVRAFTYEIDNGLNINPGMVEEVFSTVQCFPLESFLVALNVSVVDFLSLDIQGGELNVLKLFPWDRITIRALVVEYLLAADKYGVLSWELMEFMEAKGYVLIGLTRAIDYFYVKKDDRIFKNIVNSSFIMNREAVLKYDFKNT